MADTAHPIPKADRPGVPRNRGAEPRIPPSDTIALDPGHTHPSPVLADNMPAARARTAARRRSYAWIVPTLYILFLLVPIYWLVNMSLKTNYEIISGMTLWPENPTLANYRRIFTDPSWYMGYVNSITYVALNTVISIAVALPAAYAFSRYRFLGDKHLFFWLLTNRMAPPAVFALPFFQLYSSVGLFDTHLAVALAHTLFNVPLAVWILEGFMSGVPKEIDETAYIDGYSFPRFFTRIFMPLIASGIGVAAFFCFMFSWVELLLARTLTTVDAKPIASTMTRTVSASGMDWGLLAAAGVLTIIPGALVIWFVRNYIAKGFALGRV
jgi:glycerol transport system permease protein